ncbi:hypothetical protein DU43_13585 [Methanosarcina mazei]|uniref:Acyltransferase 3 domain-containing protein n=1 Tax=Methanosarcina mazei TaxID=2209 RepID=A0A0F8I8K5_METMZ|nr:hypothetical protein DU43_13585 [Methanosarcina mazei]
MLLGVIGNVMFFFTSGYLIFLNNQIFSINDITLFIRKRLFRIFPLYWISLLYSLYLSQSYNFFFAAAHFFGLQLVFTSLEKRLLWFIGCITVYYLIYPLIVLKTQSNKTIIFRSLAIFLLFLILRMQIGIFNANIFAYLPVFVLGILVSKNKLVFQKNLLKIRNISLICSIICFYWFLKTRPPMLHDNSQFGEAGIIYMLSVHIPKVIFGIALIFSLYWIAHRYIQSSSIKNTITKCAIASYPVYLFHGFAVSFFQSYTAILLGLPILFTIFYYVQIEYNTIISYLFPKRDKPFVESYSSKKLYQAKPSKAEDPRKSK